VTWLVPVKPPNETNCVQSIGSENFFCAMANVVLTT